MTDLLDRAQMFAIDEETTIPGLGSVPALTTLLYKVCGNDEAKFEEACRLITIIQKKTLELAKCGP